MVDGYYSLFSDLVLELLKTPRWQLKTQLDDLTTISSVLCSCLGHPRWEWRFWGRMFQLMLIMLMFILRRDSHAWCNIFYFSYFCISICCTFLPAGSVIRRARKREIKKVERAQSSSWVFQFWSLRVVKFRLETERVLSFECFFCSSAQNVYVMFPLYLRNEEVQSSLDSSLL